jgi:UDP-N-acetylglucosamine 2-epimerase (non-hydrolysing)
MPLMVVHGDTFTTVLGALMGHALGAPVAHIEAGLRSGDWRNPFPEELDRLITSRLAQIHLAPGAHAVANLRAIKVRGQIVDTDGNTIRDALELVPARTPPIELPDRQFGLVSLHRFELISKPNIFRAILELLREASRRTPMLFIDHPVTAAAITAHGLDAMFDDRFRRVARQRYFPFIALLKASIFLVTDSGGSQEECAQLGHPCLVHRATTERPDGLGESVVLSRMDLEVVRAFLADPTSYATLPVAGRLRPTDVIIEYLYEQGFLADPATVTTSAAQ